MVEEQLRAAVLPALVCCMVAAQQAGTAAGLVAARLGLTGALTGAEGALHTLARYLQVCTWCWRGGLGRVVRQHVTCALAVGALCLLLMCGGR